MYLVATRIRRLCCSRKPEATSSRSAMVRTSIQACGTATTTLALPKPRLSIKSTRLSASAMLSRTRHSPVTPRCTAPRRNCEAIALVVQFELKAGVVIHPAPERGGKPRLRDIDAARGHEADAAFQFIDGGSDVEFGVGGERAQLRDRSVGIARDREKALDDGERIARQRAALQRRLF